MKICIYNEETKELDEIISTGQDLQIVRVPGHYWHGFKVLGNETAWLLYLTTKLYDYNDPDEKRRPWNDPTIIPESINGRKDDPRMGKPWNCARASKLGWRPKFSFEEALEATVRWYVNNEWWWRPLATDEIIHPTPWKLSDIH